MFIWDNIIVPLSLILLAVFILFLIIFLFSIIWSTIQTFIDQRRLTRAILKECKKNINNTFKEENNKKKGK